MGTPTGDDPAGRPATDRAARVLVVDDEPQLLRALRINLAARHYDVDTADDGESALRTAAARPPDLVVLDLGLPDLDGVDVIRALRGWTPVPIIVLSGRAGSSDKVHALDAGADDYVTKPFSLDELLARIRAVTRRVGPAETPTVTIGRHRVDLGDRTIVAADGDAPHLTRTEWQLLEILCAHPGKLITQTSLLQRVWGPGYETQTHYLRQYMAHLRRKLEDDPARPRHLLTEPGMGYRFAP
ncbi:response regulator [Nakamurella sp.]|uniref:response regulator n=1 Tax=Nakamurella sp. TaxID=1869182 RepID=UPI0037838986